MSTTREERIASMKPLETPPEVLEALNELTKLSKEDVARITEVQFVNYLLPVLTDTSGKADLRVWQDLAGHALRPIDVIDIAGNALFRVPALLRRAGTRQNPSEYRHSISNIIGEGKVHLDRHPVLGATFLETRLAQVSVDGKIDYETASQWNEILKRYGKPTLPVELPGSPKSTQEPSKNVGSIFSDEEESL